MAVGSSHLQRGRVLAERGLLSKGCSSLGGGCVVTESVSPESWVGPWHPCPQPPPVPCVVRAKARGLAQSAHYLPCLLPTHLRFLLQPRQPPPGPSHVPQGLCTCCPLCPKGFPLISFRSLLKQPFLSGPPACPAPSSSSRLSPLRRTEAPGWGAGGELSWLVLFARSPQICLAYHRCFICLLT